MTGANIFVMYTSSNGENVTVSPRLGTGYTEPQHTTDTDLELLEGSGVSDGVMTANVRCGNCNSWGSDGTMDFKSASNTDWIHGYKSGDPLNSDDLSESISRHDQAEAFTWDLASAQGGDDVNPFVTTSAATDPSSSGSTTSSNTTTGTNSTTSSGSSSSSGGGSMVNADMVQLAHGVMASLAFVAIFPIGGILIRIPSIPGLLWVHGLIQMLGYFIFVAAFGMGVWIASTGGYLSTSHAIIGIILFVLLFAQPIGGLLHHHFFKKTGGRTIVSYLHVNLGRVAIILGMINGGLGLKLASVEQKYVIVYSVFAAIMGIAYIAAMIVGEVKKSRQGPAHLSSFEEKNETSSQEGIALANAKERPNSQREEHYGQS